MKRVRPAGSVKADEPEIRPCSDCLACVRACPTGALKYHNRTWSIDLSICFRCDTCATVCPNHMIAPQGD